MNIIAELKYFELWFGPHELLLLVGWVVTFGIKDSHHSDDESRLSQGLNVKASKTNFTWSGDLELCVFRLTRMSGLNGESL